MNVCYKCTVETGRSATCHATCKKYIDAKAEYETKRELIRKDRLSNSQYNQYKFDIVHQYKKRRNSK